MEVRRFLVWSVISLISGLGACNLCLPSDNESVLQEIGTYSYRYRSEALAEAVGTTPDHGKITLECDVHIVHHRDCFYNLDLHDCVVTASGEEPGSQTAWIDHQPLPDLSKYPVAFTLSFGEIKEVKTHDEDPIYVVNIKRGILSAFVFKLSQTKGEIHESHTDIHGTCPLTSVPDDKTEGMVKTSKDMLLCSYPSRPDWQFSPWSIFWNMSFIQHVINSTTDCEYRVNEGAKRIEKVFCKERHAIMLESTHRTTTAVQTNLFYNLDYVKFETSRPLLPILTRKTDILFEYEHTPVPQSSPPNFLTVAKKMLSDLVLDSVDEIRLFTIPQFTDFVGWIRASHDLKPLVDSLKDCSFLPDGTRCDQNLKELAYSYTSDALLQCSSLPCAKGLSYMAMNSDLSSTYLNFVFLSWSYVHYSEPGFISNFVDICRLKNSHQCWLSLGSFVRRTYAKYSDLDNKVLQEVTEVASYFYNRIAEECHVTTNADKSYSECLIFLKAASNIGQCYSRIAPDAVDQLLKLATNDHVPIVIRTSAFEALKEVSDSRRDPEQRRATYDRLLPLLKSSDSASSIRILSYEQLLRVFGDGDDFGQPLLDILRNDTNAEVKFYLAQSLSSLTKDPAFGSKLFLLNLTRELRNSGLSLERILYETKGRSKSSSYDAFLSLPIMPDYIRRFGLKLKDAFIYDSPLYPAVFSHEALFQLFSTFVPTTRLGSYFEGWEELILSFRKNLAHMNGRSASLAEISEALMKALAQHRHFDEESLRNFDENIIQNLKKIHRLYWEHHKKLDPYAKAYLDLFGSTIKYFVQDNLQSSEGIGKVLHSFAQSLAEGVTYNATRVIRVIEAYHQVPTMMGLPLNWTTNATLAFSFRANLKFQMSRQDDQIHSKGFLQPSAALTFLNRMVLDFPTLTQIGVQANSSGYTSTELKGQYDSTKGKHILRFERPARTQKILELFRTNQLIKHDRSDDIPDWDIARTSSSWCTKDKSDAGVKFCLSKSYPNVTHRIKPWALMAGWCKWQFLAHPTGSDDVHYDLELLQASKQKVKELTAKFTVAEKNRMKSSSIQMTVDESGSGTKLELKTSLIPDFSASFSKNEISSKKVSGHKIQAALKILKDFKYELEYTSEAKAQKSSVKTNSPPEENSQTLEHEQQLKVKTPYSAYKWKRTLLKLGENFKAEASIDYENLKTESEWMKGILPAAFWANDKEASLKILVHWKKPIYSSQDTVTRQTEFRVQIPLYVMTLDAHSVQSRDREQTVVSLARTDVELGKVDTFLNFTSGSWTDRDHSSRIHVFNVTIPRKSWSVSFESGHVQGAFHHELKLRRAVMKPTNDGDEKYIGWWSKEVSDRFSIDEQEVKLTSDFQVHMWSEDDIANKFSSVAKEDLENISNAVYGVKVAAHYPFSDKIETVDFDGYFILGTGDRIFRFQKTFNLTSSYNNLRLTSHSVYRNDDDGGRTLYHNSHFIHLTTKTKAYNTIHFQMGKTVGRCQDIEFNHYIRSHVMDLSTDATYKCESDVDGLHTLRLKLNTNSSKWNMLDMKLDQIVEDVSPSYSKEEMTTYHALGTIHVDAEWFIPEKRHEKHVVLCSKEGNCPNAELFLEFRPGDKIIRFRRHDYEITCRSRLSSDNKALLIEVGYGNKEDGDSPVLEFTGDVLSRNYHVWKGTLHAGAFHKVKDIFTSGCETFRSAFVEVAADQNHPLNEILRPALKMTLIDYWNSLRAQFLDFFALTWAEVMDLFQVICVTTEPAYNILVNSAAAFKQSCASTYHYLEQKSVTVWAISYFDVPYYFQQGITSLPQYLSYFWNQLAVGEESVMHFRFVTGKFMSLRSFLEWPAMDFDPRELFNFFTYGTGKNAEAKRDDRAKVALLFGPLHVYTFDGHLYEFPNYPREECAFLLAHDVHRSLFTVFSSEKGIHLLFPEMSVTINDQNEVFVNGSQEQSSLPIQSSNGKVTVKRGHVVEVWSPSLSVICRAEDFLCILKLSNYHIGGIIGLLGNADHNATNEFTLPSGKPTSLIDFARNYEISGKPECQNLELTTASLPALPEEGATICSKALAAECWDHPDIREQFTAACMSDVRAGHGTCYAAAGLSALCDLKYQPSHTDCSAIKQHDDRTIGRNLEVVLVVHESKYLMSADKSSSPAKGIESLVKAVDDRFKGYDKIHYSLVGYGGNGVHYYPTVYSSRKNIWSNSGDIINGGLKTLEFKSREEADGVKALKYAIEELGQDTFGSKVFIVITAKDKQVADKELLSFIHSKLEANGITLYVISSYPSIEKGKKVFGLRADGLIFPSQTEEGEAYMNFPKGNLAKLSSSTRGAVFLSKFLKDNHPSAFFAEVAQEMWAKVNKEAQKCRSCSVYKGSMWWSRRECHIVPCL